MNPNPNLQFNVIKGLQIFIGDIRNCTTKEQEVKRVENELDKIRKKFSANKVLTGYDKKKYVWKLIYAHILGYDIDFGHNYAADLITSIKFSEKIAGYISMSILFKDNTSEISVMVNSIKNDLLNQNAVCQSMALTLAANLNNSELLMGIHKEVLKFLTNFSEKQSHTIKKALVVLCRLIKLKPDMLNAEKWAPALLKIIEMKNFESLLALCSLVYNILTISGPAGYEAVAEKLFNTILLKMKDCPEHFNPETLSHDTLKNAKDYSDYIAKKTLGIVGADIKYSRYYAEYCIFFEAVSFVDHFSKVLHGKTFESFIDILGIYLSEASSRKRPNKDVNTRYLALDAMAKLSKYTSGNKILKSHSNVIISSLHDNDISIRRKALELMFLVCTEDSVKLITKEMLLYFKEDEPQLKEDIALKVAILSEKYAQDFKWYIESIVKMIELAGDYVSEDIVFRFLQIMTGFENQEQSDIIQKYAVEKVIKLLEKEFVNENGVRLSCLILGEFGFLVAENVNDVSIYRRFISSLKRHVSNCSTKVVLVFFNACMKFSKYNDELLSDIIPILEDYLESWDPELQQRAIEYIILCKTHDDNIPDIGAVRQNVFNKMPAFSQDHLNNSILMKRLSKQNKSLYSKTKEGFDAIKTGATNNNNTKADTTKSEAFVNKSFSDTNMDKLSEMVASMHYDVETHPFSYHTIFQKDRTAFAAHINKMFEYAEKIEIKNIQNNLAEFRSFITNINNSGPIYNNAEYFSIDLKLKSLEKGVLGSMLNITSQKEIANLEVTSSSSPSGLEVMVSKVKQVSESNCQVLVKTILKDSFVQPIVLNIKGELNNQEFETTVALPVLVTKFLDYYDVSIEEYTAMWLEFSATSSDETQRFDSIMYNPLDGKPIMDFLKKLGGLLTGLGFKVFSPNDSTNYHEIEACGILIYEDNKMIPVLVQASFVPSLSTEFRFSIRTKNKDITVFSNLTLDLYSIVKFFVNPK